jgi:23S rRNA pseudouridine1911/1915/1917 synthase
VPTPPRDAETFVVGDGDGVRLDQFLVRHVPGCSRRQARLAIGAGAVLVNGRRGRKGQALRPGDVVRADRAAWDGAPAAQPDLAVSVLYEDGTMVAVDKPAGMAAIALRVGDRDTVANYLLGRYPDLCGVGDAAFEAGLAHRLDTATSGVLIAARNDAAWRRLREQFRDRRVDKLYLAVVSGDVRRGGTIVTPIAHRPRRRREMCVCEQPERARLLRARPALTRYRPLWRLGEATLLAVRIPTGVRHQIRVHLASIGHPVLGDPVYGETAATPAAPRLLLHASRLAFAHPVDGRRVIIRSALPEEFLAALRCLQGGQR